MSRFKIGIIGCGRAAQSLHIPAIQNLTVASVIAVADIDNKCAYNTAKTYKIPSHYDNYKELLANPEVEIVLISVPPKLHAKVAIDAIGANKHVLIEKPLALNLEDCNSIITAAEQSDCKISVGFNLRYHVLIQQAKQMLEQGKLGTIKSIKSHWSTNLGLSGSLPMWRKELVHVNIWEIAVHHFDLWRFLTGCEVKEIQTMATMNRDFTNIMGYMDNDILVSGSFSQTANNCNTIEIYGDQGRLVISLYRFDGLEYCHIEHFPESISSRITKLGQILRQLPKGFKEMREGGNFKISYVREWQNFLDCVTHNTAPQVSLQDGKSAVQIALAAVTSIQAKQTMPIERI